MGRWFIWKGNSASDIASVDFTQIRNSSATELAIERERQRIRDFTTAASRRPTANSTANLIAVGARCKREHHYISRLRPFLFQYFWQTQMWQQLHSSFLSSQSGVLTEHRAVLRWQRECYKGNSFLHRIDIAPTLVSQLHVVFCIDLHNIDKKGEMRWYSLRRNA